MAHTNDYLVPHLDGLPYLDKPIVYFAAAAALMELLGPTETAARLPAYAATLATIGLLVGFARRRWGSDAGWLAGIAYATTLLPLDRKSVVGKEWRSRCAAERVQRSMREVQ